MPPEYVLSGRSAASSRPNCSSSSGARVSTSFFAMWVSRPTMRRFSEPVRFSSTVAYWPANPISRRTVSASRTTSWPSTAACPLSGARMVERIRTTVVLPAPLGPSSPSTVPVATSSDTPSSARTSGLEWKTFTRSYAATATRSGIHET